MGLGAGLKPDFGVGGTGGGGLAGPSPPQPGHHGWVDLLLNPETIKTDLLESGKVVSRPKEKRVSDGKQQQAISI